jgi:N-acetylglutamate synthase-like GNAT family acetyltransferase
MAVPGAAIHDFEIQKGFAINALAIQYPVRVLTDYCSPATASLVATTEMEIRRARIEDAPAACDVLRRSITELCVADHHDDPAILQRWLANKTPQIVASWIARPGNTMLVATEDDTILGVGSVTDTGEITVNYVSPDARFRGVSRALISALENRAVQCGNTRCYLTSTETARGFYHRAGYSEDGPPAGKFGTSGSYPMSKALAPLRL